MWRWSAPIHLALLIRVDVSCEQLMREYSWARTLCAPRDRENRIQRGSQTRLSSLNLRGPQPCAHLTFGSWRTETSHSLVAKFFPTESAWTVLPLSLICSLKRIDRN